MNQRTLWTGLFAALLLTAGLDAQEGYAPPRFIAGNVPQQPPLAAEGGVVTLELEIAASGIVVDTVVLDDAPPYTEAVSEAVRLWTFQPAEEDGRAVSGKFLVAGVFRPPVLLGNALPKPKKVRNASDEVPYPTATVTPSYPPTALYDGVCLIEVEIDTSGSVRDARVRSAAAAYDEIALEAAKGFRFRPARRDGSPIASSAILLFGFRQPVTVTKPRR